MLLEPPYVPRGCFVWSGDELRLGTATGPPAIEKAAARALLQKKSHVDHFTHQLSQMKPSQLQKRALEGGCKEEEVAEALDSDDPKAALIALIVAQASAPKVHYGIQRQTDRRTARP